MDGSSCTVTLWHASGVEVPAKLLAALTKAGMQIQRAGDPFLALAQMCLAKHLPSAEKSGAKLVILYPEMLTDAAEFCLAADIYAPGIARWQYGPATNPELRAIVDEDVARWSGKIPESTSTPRAPAPSVVVRPEAIQAAERVIRGQVPLPTPSRALGPTPQLRLAGEGPAHKPLDNPSETVDALGGPGGLAGLDAGDDAHPAPSRSHLITDEELRMLLGESTEDKPEQG